MATTPQTPEKHQTNNHTDNNSDYADEIDLVDLVAILWRRRWLMAAVFIIIVGLAVAYCFIATPKYKITAQLSPGITGFGRDEIPVRSWSAKDIENWFSQEGYIDVLIGKISDPAKMPEMKATTVRNSNVVTVSFIWPDPEEGKQLLQSVINFLLKNEAKSIQQLIGSRGSIKQKIYQLEKDKEQISIDRERLKDAVQKTQQQLAVDKQSLEHEILKLEKKMELIPIERTQFNNRIMIANNKIKVLKTKLSSIERNKALAKVAATLIKKKIDRVNNNTEELMRLRQSTLTKNSDQLALLMYSNIVQQNISFATNLQRRLEDLEKEINRYNDEISTRVNEIENTKIAIQELETKRDQELEMKNAKIKKNILKLKAELTKKIKDAETRVQELTIKRNQELSMKNDKLQENINTLKIMLSTLTPIEVNQIPFSSIKPDSPKKVKIVALAIVLGSFIAMFAAFSKEFWFRNKEQIKKSKNKSITYR